MGDKIHFQLPSFANGDSITFSEQLHIYDVFQNLPDITLVIAIDSLSQAMIGQIDFFLKLQKTFPNQIFPRD